MKVNENFDDFVYDETFYEMNYEEETLKNPDEIIKEEKEEDNEITLVILVCQDCAHQWEEEIDSDEEKDKLFCPLCGSHNILNESY